MNSLAGWEIIRLCNRGVISKAFMKAVLRRNRFEPGAHCTWTLPLNMKSLDETWQRTDMPEMKRQCELAGLTLSLIVKATR